MARWMSLPIMASVAIETGIIGTGVLGEAPLVAISKAGFNAASIAISDRLKANREVPKGGHLQTYGKNWKPNTFDNN